MVFEARTKSPAVVVVAVDLADNVGKSVEKRVVVVVEEGEEASEAATSVRTYRGTR